MATKTNQTKRLALTGIMLALGVILSLIKVFEFPTGGSITAFSMLPVMVIGYTYGVPWGLMTGLVYGVLQAVLGATMTSAFAGQSVGAVVGILFFDYLAAFSMLGLAGLFKGKIKNHAVAFALGCVVAGFARYLCHLISGYIFFGSYAEWFFTEAFVNSFSSSIMQRTAAHPQLLAVIYSAIYNAIYLVPETVITAVGAVLLISLVPPVRKEMTRAHK